MRVLLVRECAEPPRDLRAPASFAGFAERDLEVPLGLFAARRSSRAGVARRASTGALQLARHAPAQAAQLRFARGDKDQRFLCELIREQPLVGKVVIRCVVSGVRR